MGAKVDRRADAVRKSALRQSDRQAAFRAVFGGFQQTSADHLHESFLQRRFLFQFQRRRKPPNLAQQLLCVLGGAEFGLDIRGVSRFRSSDDKQRKSGLAEIGADGFVHVFHDSHDANHRRWIDAFAERLVVEADIAAGDWGFQLLAGLGDAINGLRELPHDMRLLGIAEVQAISGRDWGCAGAGNVAGRLRHRVHGAQLGIEVAPAAIAVERHRQAALGPLDANHSALAARALHRVGLHHGVVLLEHPALAADVRAGEQSLQIVGEFRLPAPHNVCRNLAWHGRLPAFQRPMVKRGIIGERGVGDFRDYFAVLQHSHGGLSDHAPDGDGVESPLLEDAEHFVLAASFGHQQHALLRFAQHDFVRRHRGLALGHKIELNFQPHTAPPAHLAGRAGEPRRSHVLNADNRAGLHGFQAGFEQQFFQKGVADLHVRPLGLRLFAELFARHGGAVDAIPAGLGADVDHRIAFPGGPGVEDLVAAHQSQRKRVDQRISRVAAFELHLAADIRHAEAVSVGCDAAHHAFQHGVVLVQRGPIETGLRRDRAEAQRIHDGDGARAHGKDVTQDAANPSGRALEGLDERRMIVRLDFEGAGPAIADVNDTGVLPGPLHHATAVRG